ncbi:MAG: DNA alkylation repair protein [Candidatus Nanopelagicaceae bacterium]
MAAESVLRELKSRANARKAVELQRFFKTDKGEYAEGDIFLGIAVPEIRKVAREYEALELTELAKLMASPLHEVRFSALVILTSRFKKAKSAAEEKRYYTFYIKVLKKGQINNWDLIDVSAPTIGQYLLNEKGSLTTLRAMANSKVLWIRRAAILFTFASLRIGDTKPTIDIARALLRDNHDLMHKAVGWALREVGKRNPGELLEFLRKHGKVMSRTTLRYAIEKFSAAERKRWLEVTR